MYNICLCTSVTDSLYEYNFWDTDNEIVAQSMDVCDDEYQYNSTCDGIHTCDGNNHDMSIFNVQNYGIPNNKIQWFMLCLWKFCFNIALCIQ